MRLVGLFPTFGEIGGVQTSGALAAHALGTLPVEFSAITYGRRVPQQHVSAHAATKFGALLSTLRFRTETPYILVWHLGLAKLLPFLARPASRVCLFLHGIECWRKLTRFEQLCLQNVTLFLANSEFTWERFVASNPRFALCDHLVLPLGCGIPVRESTQPKSPPSAVVASRLTRREDYKGHRQLISAWPRVESRIPGARLIVIGDGDLRRELQRLAGGNEAVRFTGLVDEAAKTTLIADSRALLMPSRGEGFGLSYLEAMRLGRPALVSDRDAGREVVNPPECGLAVDPDDTDALVEAIVRLLTPGSQWDTWSANAQRRYESFYTEKHFRERLVGAVQGLMER